MPETWDGGRRKSMRVTLAETPSIGDMELEVAIPIARQDFQWRAKDTNLPIILSTPNLSCLQGVQGQS